MALQQEFEYYVKHQSELVKKYEGKYLVIKDQSVVGVYDNELDAYREASDKYEAGSFLIQPCTPGSESYSQTFYSRVSIS